MGEEKIRGTGKVLYEVDGEAREFNPAPKKSLGGGKRGLNVKWFDDKAPMFHKKYDLDLLKRLNFSMAIEEPIGKFVSLYVLLTSRCKNDSQEEADKLIEKEYPNVGKSISPKTSLPETIFTRLRNELSHNRAGNSVIATHRSIELHLPIFEHIVKSIIERCF